MPDNLYAADNHCCLRLCVSDIATNSNSKKNSTASLNKNNTNSSEGGVGGVSIDEADVKVWSDDVVFDKVQSKSSAVHVSVPAHHPSSHALNSMHVVNQHVINDAVVQGGYDLLAYTTPPPFPNIPHQLYVQPAYLIANFSGTDIVIRQQGCDVE